eukprot:5246215-Prymnesium_polylepis.1
MFLFSAQGGPGPLKGRGGSTHRPWTHREIKNARPWLGSIATAVRIAVDVAYRWAGGLLPPPYTTPAR